MKSLIAITLASTMLAGCNTMGEHYRAGDPCLKCGDSYVFYPFEEGYSDVVQAQGEQCWAQSNRANWDLCY